jgi:O-antigen/teichoic acid export membrane protein
VLALLLFPIALGLSSLLPVLLPLVYGRDFAAAVPSAIVMVAFSCLAFGNVGSAALQGLERASFVAAVGALGAVASVLAGLFIIPWAGIWGAAWARVAIQTGMVAAGVIYLSRRHGFPFPTRDMARMLVAAAACAACSAAIVWTAGTVASVVLAIPVSAVVYAILVRQWRVIRREDLLLLQELADRFPAPLIPTVRAAIGHLRRGPARPQSSAP